MKSGWMVVAGFLFGWMGVFVKIGSAHFSSAELVFYRSLIGLLVIFSIVRIKHYPLATPYLKMHIWRGLSGFIALMLFFYAIAELPLATAVTLNYTSPLFLAVLSIFVLGERHRKTLLFALAVGFVGVVILLHPTINRGQVLAGLMGLASGMLAGVAYLNVRQLGQMNEPEWRVVFYFTLVSTVGAGGWMLMHEFHPLSWKSIILLVGLGTTATLAQLAMTRAYRVGKTMVAGSLAYSTVVFASLFGWLLWGETLSLEAWAGIALIILSGVVSVRATQAG